MTELVLDASVVLKWFHGEGERNLEPARELRSRFEDGDVHVLAPPLIWLEILNVAARSWKWEANKLETLAVQLPDLGFEMVEPELESVAHWSAAGLSAYDAAYVTVAEGAGVDLMTDDSQIVKVAPGIAVALTG